MAFRNTPDSFLRLLLLLLFPAGVSPGPAEGGDFVFACDPERWHPTLSLEGKTGSREIGLLDFTMPLRQNEDSMFFFDFRGWVDDDHNDEYNVGFAYRKVLDERLIGFYGFWDRHFSRVTRNRFDQITVGAELLGEVWDHRINGYFPTDLGGRATGTGNLAIVNNRLFVSGLEERAYPGFDYEAGKLLRCFGQNHHELRVYGGGFFFQNDAGGYETIAGPRLRMEMRLFDVSLLGEGSRVTLTGEVTWDQVRETRGFAGIGFQVPLGKFGKRGFQGHSPFGAASGHAGLSPLERRMYDPIIRDVDVVTNTSGRELANDAEDDPLFVASARFDLDGQIRNAGRNGTVIVDGAIATPGNHRLLEGQRLAGGNSIQTVTGTTTGRTITSRLPGRQGILTGSNPLNPLVRIANNTTVDSLILNGGLNGISGGSVSNVTLINNRISGAVRLPAGPSGDGDGSGIAIMGAFDGLIANNTLSGNESNGIYVGTNRGTIAGNTTSGNTDDGIDVANDNDGVIRGNVSIADGDESIEVKGDNNGTISGNRSTLAGDNGIEMGGTNFGMVTGNIVTLAADDGFDFQDNAGIISGNTASSNSEDGIDLDGTNFGVIRNNIANGNGIDGFSLVDNAGLLSGNIANGNAFDGFYLDGGNFGTITGNTATGNFANGFALFFNDVTGTISGNTAATNLLGGGFLLLANDGTLRNNMASANAAGFVIDFNPGIMSGNTADSNLFFGFGPFPLGPLANTDSTGDFSTNTASDNGAEGFKVDNNGGTAAGNVSTGNSLANTGTAVP